MVGFPPLKPTLQEFDEVLQLLAREASPTGDATIVPWIRNSISAAGVKLRALQFISKHASPDSHPTLLDLGAQIGSLTLYASRLGVKSAAVDLPYFADTYATISQKHGVDYRPCDLSTSPLPFPELSFDYVTYLDVIEHHAHSPKRVLAEIRRVLKPQGCLIVSTPNQASIYNRVKLLGGGTVSDPFDYFFETAAQDTPYPGHHREYVRSELRYALMASGFHVLESQVIDDDFAPTLWHVKISSNDSMLRKLWQYKMHLGATAAGHFWPFFRLPFGRVLWFVAEKNQA